MKKRLIVEENGRSGLIEIEPHETFHGNIIWDESKDGPITEGMLDKTRWLKRDDSGANSALVEDSALKTQVLSEDQSKEQKITDKNNLMQSLKDFDGKDAGSGAILLKLLKHLNLN